MSGTTERNPYLVEAARLLGGMKHLADHLGVSYQALYRWTYNRNGHRPVAHIDYNEIERKLCSLVGCLIEDVLPSKSKSIQCLSLNEIADGSILTAPECERNYDNQELREQIEASLASLSHSRREQVIRMRFGLAPYGREHTLEETAETIGVTRERVRQIEASALRRLRHPSRKKNLRPYFIKLGVSAMDYFSLLASQRAALTPPPLDTDDPERRKRRILAPPDESTPDLDAMTSPQAVARLHRYGFDEPTPAQPVARNTRITAPESAPTIPMRSLSLAPPPDGQANFERVTTPAPRSLPVAERSAAPISTPPASDLQRVGNDRPMSANDNFVGQAAPQRQANPYADLINEGPATHRLNDMLAHRDYHQPGEHVGIGERFVHGLKEGGKLFLRSGFNPLVGLGGFAEGAIDPNAYHRLTDSMRMPGAITAANEEQNTQTEKLKHLHMIEQMTDRDPFSGDIKPSVRAMMDYRGIMGQAAALKAQTGKYSAIARTQHWENLDKASRQKLIKGLVDNGEINVGDQDDMEWAANEMGVPAHLKPAFKAGAIKVNDKFQYVDVRTGQPVADNQGQPIVSGQATVEGKKTERFNRTQTDRERHEKEMESQGRQHIGIAQQNANTNAARATGSTAARREALKGIDQHNRYKREGDDFYNKANGYRQRAESSPRDADKYNALADEFQARAESRWRAADDRAQELGADYPEHVEVGQQGGHFYVKPKADARTAAPRTPVSKRSADPLGIR